MGSRISWHRVLRYAGIFLLVASVTARAIEPPPPQSTTPPAKASLATTHPAATIQPSPSATTHGELLKIDGVRVLRIWGTAEQRGHAHGFLLGHEIVTLLDKFLANGHLGGSPEGYVKKVLPMLRLMTIQPQYEAEMHGILAGVEEMHGGPVSVPSLGRKLKYEDIVAVNCVPDLSRLACSSFAAWGSLTRDGETIVGRNLDWYTVPALENASLVLVQMHQPSEGQLDWASLTWPGLIVCTTGFNTEGVVVSMHDANGKPPSVEKGFTPRGFALREAVERAHAKTAFDDAGQILRKRTCAVGNNVMVAKPSSGDGMAAVVFEYDGDETKGDGITRRKPGHALDQPAGQATRSLSPYIICTNHYRKRADATPCGRFEGLVKSLLQECKAHEQLDITEAGQLLSEAAFPRGQATHILTHHSAVFEPNKRLMHIAFSQGNAPATQCKRVTLHLTKLLFQKPSGGK